jgi:hypothetical protein
MGDLGRRPPVGEEVEDLPLAIRHQVAGTAR